MKSYSTLAAAFCVITLARAQSSAGPEHWGALHARPTLAAAPLRDGVLNERFIYEYDPQLVPVVDDFSIDRTRHLNASSSDAGVTLTETIYELAVGNVSEADMSFVLDTTFHVTVDYEPDDTIITYTPWPSITVQVFDLSAYPPPDTMEVTAWPPYTITDVEGELPDTTFLPVDLIQDSLLVYTVAPAGGTYTNPDNSTRPLVLWENDDVYVNGTYPIEPPTIGVASFDGMDRTGYPYEPENPNSEGLADLLTSVPINWPAGTDVGDSVYLSFFFQPQGRSGDVDVDETDSLFLDLYAPTQHQWFREWETPYTPLAPFKQVMIPIDYALFLQDGFRMRFSNRATLGGAVDHWHIDYVRLGLNRSYSDTLLQDVSWAYPANTLLSAYTAMPFNKFMQDPGLYMAPSVDLSVRNLFNSDATITWTYGVGGECASPAFFSNYGASIIDNANSTVVSNHPVASAPNNFTYDLGACTDLAFAEVAFATISNPDALVYNDTTKFIQEFSNYYSYDDGSAEQGYWLNTNGGRIAYRFDTQGQDSLRAVRMYFDPIFTYGDIPNDPRDGSFLITVWQDLDEDPIFQNISFSSPEYRLWGPDYFVEYPLDSTIAVGGTFYVGWTQTNAVKMNLGLDKNRVNTDRMFYNVGSAWQQSQAPGSWMIRPVMVGPVDPFAAVEEQEMADLRLYPNPAAEEVRCVLTGPAPRTIEVIDATGRRVSGTPYRADGIISVACHAEGIYLVRALDANGRPVAQQRLIVQRR